MTRVTRISALLLFVVLAAFAMPFSSQAQVAVGVSIRIGPPALPVYPQPVCPGPGYIWTPGYWGYGPGGYYWVPGTWVIAPHPGYLWTPGYWGWGNGGYLWHAGYWGPHVGFYGGINYGYGYNGVGFVGGEWRGSVFHYNTAVTNVNTTIIHNTYVNRTVINNTVINRVSYNGGTGGISARPTHAEEIAMRERHFQATSLQADHERMARNDHTMLASYNHGRPSIAATPRPGAFKDHDAVGAHPDHFNDRPHGNDNHMAHSDRPNNAHVEAHPQNTMHPGNPHENPHQPGPGHPNNVHPNEPHAEAHMNEPHSPQHENHPQEHQVQAHEGGHEGGPGHNH